MSTSADGRGNLRRPFQFYDLFAQDACRLICEPAAQVHQVPQDPDDLGRKQVHGCRMALVALAWWPQDTGLVAELAAVTNEVRAKIAET